MPIAAAEPPLPYARPPTAQANGHRPPHTGPPAGGSYKNEELEDNL